MDQDDESHERRRKERATSKLPKHKYADIMQKLADRSIDEVLIELDDVAAVCLTAFRFPLSHSNPTILHVHVGVYVRVHVRLTSAIQWEDDSNEELKLVQSIEANTKHYVEVLSRAIDKKMPPPTSGVTYDKPS